MKPRWKSLWMTRAACGAVAPALIVQARASFGPAVRNVCRPSARNPAWASWVSPGSPAGLGEQFGGLVLGQLGQVGFGLGVEEDRLGGTDERGQAPA